MQAALVLVSSNSHQRLGSRVSSVLGGQSRSASETPAENPEEEDPFTLLFSLENEVSIKLVSYPGREAASDPPTPTPGDSQRTSALKHLLGRREPRVGICWSGSCSPGLGQPLS